MHPTLSADDPRAQALSRALDAGDLPALLTLLDAQPEVAAAVFVTATGPAQGGRTALHVLADWPGHRPRAPEAVQALVRAGAQVDAPFEGSHQERPLHWAASNDDVALLDALLDAGADVDAPGSVIDGGPPLSDAVAFAQWRAARRLVARGARVNLWQAAALGLVDDVAGALRDGASPDACTRAFWCACHGGQRGTAALLLDAGADPTWRGWDGLTPLQAAARTGGAEVVAWLQEEVLPRGT